MVGGAERILKGLIYPNSVGILTRICNLISKAPNDEDGKNYACLEFHLLQTNGDMSEPTTGEVLMKHRNTSIIKHPSLDFLHSTSGDEEHTETLSEISSDEELSLKIKKGPNFQELNLSKREYEKNKAFLTKKERKPKLSIMNPLRRISHNMIGITLTPSIDQTESHCNKTALGHKPCCGFMPNGNKGETSSSITCKTLQRCNSESIVADLNTSQRRRIWARKTGVKKKFASATATVLPSIEQSNYDGTPDTLKVSLATPNQIYSSRGRSKSFSV